jgi:putative transposase
VLPSLVYKIVMGDIRTIKCRLEVESAQADALNETLSAFARACNHVSDASRQAGETRQFCLHRLCYRNVREKFGLSANLAVRAIARVASAKKGESFRPTSVDFDERILSFRERDWTFSLTTTKGRVRLKAVLGDYQKSALAGRKPTSAQLVCKGGVYYLHIQVKSPAPEVRQVSDYLGVDLGLANIATDSTGQQFSGEGVERNRRRRTVARKQYQRAGTKSAKRRLRKMAGRQARYQRHVNHVVSKTVVEKAKTLNAGVALENLLGIRGRTEKTAGKALRQRLGNWSFYQLRQFIEYKARREGVPVVLVKAAYSSQTCSSCGHCEEANRSSQSVFHCEHCLHSMNADENAALNIRAWAVCKPAPKVSALRGQGQSPCL